MNKIRLKYKGITEIVGKDTLALIVLVNAENTRQVTVICDKTAEHQFMMRMGQHSSTSEMLPEVMWKLLQPYASEMEIIIDSIQQGEYKAFVYNKTTFDMLKIRACDAILLSNISNIPLFMEEGLMNRQSVPYRENSRGMSIPLNVLDNKMLEEALEKAIKDENYELASILRDELQKRDRDSKQDKMENERN